MCPVSTRGGDAACPVSTEGVRHGTHPPSPAVAPRAPAAPARRARPAVGTRVPGAGDLGGGAGPVVLVRSLNPSTLENPSLPSPPNPPPPHLRVDDALGELRHEEDERLGRQLPQHLRPKRLRPHPPGRGLCKAHRRGVGEARGELREDLLLDERRGEVFGERVQVLPPCPLSTGGRTRLVRSVRGEGRDVSA